MKRGKNNNRNRKGFTLIEMTIVIFVSLTIATASLALLNQSIAFFTQMKSRSFLTQEAPMAGTVLAKLLSDSDRYLLHADLSSYLSGSSQVTTGAGCLTLVSMSNGQLVAIGHIVANSSGSGIYFYSDAAATQPNWAISNSASVAFALNEGILQTTISGTNGESITYSGSFEL